MTDTRGACATIASLVHALAQKKNIKLWAFKVVSSRTVMGCPERVQMKA